MPLFKRKPFSLLEPPEDLDPKEEVYQVRFTKEIFRDYQEYLKRLNLYRQRLWTCKWSGKSNLTYEEALVSEHHAAEKAQQLQKELIVPVLRMIQYSTLPLNELVNKIYMSLQEDVFEGLELHAKKGESEAACKILKIIDSSNTKMCEVGWLGKDKTIISTSLVKADDLIRKRAPVSRSVLKIFIRESTSQSFPWVIHENLAKKHGISVDPPQDMMKGKRRLENGTMEGVDNAAKRLKKVKYPIEDMLVKPTADDPIFSKRPLLSTDFRVPIDTVGDLLMVWDFCLSFGRLLSLSPFSLTDLENAICHKESNLVLLVEIHAAIFHLLIKDGGEYFTVLKNKKRKLKVTLVTWAEYLCDFLEMLNREEFSSNIATVRRGYYGLMDTRTKLKILRELAEQAIATSAVREKLDERMNKQQALVATKREDARKKKEEQNLNDEGTNENEMSQVDAEGNGKESVDGQSRGKEGKDKNKVCVNGQSRGKEGKDKNKESVSCQSRGKEGKDKNNISGSKIEEGKFHLTRHLEAEIEKLTIRTNSLGKDRDYNRYWFFRREGRLFVESADSGHWGYYSTKEELDALMGSLNEKGIRERALKRQLEKFYNKISNALEKRSKDVEQKMLLEEAVLRRSTRVRAQPRDNPVMGFLKYVNKWKDN